MKTLCSFLGLLLLTACCCNAMPKALKYNTSPVNCCLKFNGRNLPSGVVSNITKSHSSCLKQAFIVQTIKGKMICYRQTFQWALDKYNQHHNKKSSREQP